MECATLTTASENLLAKEAAMGKKQFRRRPDRTDPATAATWAAFSGSSLGAVLGMIPLNCDILIPAI